MQRRAASRSIENSAKLSCEKQRQYSSLKLLGFFAGSQCKVYKLEDDRRNYQGHSFDTNPVPMHCSYAFLHVSRLNQFESHFVLCV